MRSLCLRPLQPIHSPLRLNPTLIIHLAVVLEQAIIDLFQVFDEQHDILGCMSAVHQDESKQKFLLIHRVCQHVMHMLRFGLAIPVWIINAIVNDLELVQGRVDIHSGHHPDPFDDPMCISIPLSLHQICLERVLLIHNRVIKHQIYFRYLFHLTFHIVSYQGGIIFSHAKYGLILSWLNFSVLSVKLVNV